MKINKKILIILILFLIFIMLFMPFVFCSDTNEDYKKISLGVSSYDDNEYFVILDSGDYSTLSYPYIIVAYQEYKSYVWIYLAYSNSPMVLQRTISSTDDNPFYYLQSTNDDIFYHCGYMINKDDIDNYTYDLNYLSPTISPSSYTSLQSGVSALSLYVYSTFDVKDVDSDEVLFFATSSSSDSDDITNQVNSILGGSNIDTNTITDSIANSDWSSSLNETDSSLIDSGPQSVSSAFSSIFNIFNFIGNVKNAMLNVYNLIDKSSDVDFYHDSSYGVDFAPALRWEFNNEYLQGTYEIFSVSWYIPYKKYGDSIITAFCYIAFILHVFRNLPNYVSGANSVGTNINIAMDDDSSNNKGKR